MRYVVKGYKFLPSPRISTSWDVMGVLYYKNAPMEVPGSVIQENIKWWHFLGKYVTTGSIMSQTATDVNQMKSAVFWCPSFEGYTDGNGVNLVGTTATYPAMA